MTIQLKESNIFSIFNVSICGDIMTMRVEANSPWNYQNLYELLQAGTQMGVRSVLVDKRNHITTKEAIGEVCLAENLTSYIVEENLRFAAVLNEADQFEKIACYNVMREGGQVLSTACVEEAMLWLGGALK